MQVKQRLRINAVVMALSVIAVIAVFFVTTHRVIRVMEANKIADGIITTAFERVTLRSDYLRTGNDRAREQIRAKQKQMTELLKSASETFTVPEDQETINALVKGNESIGKNLRAIIENREKTGQRGRSPASSGEVEDRLLNQLNMRVYETVLLAGRLQDSTNAALVSALGLAGGGIALVFLLAGAGTLINSWIMGRTITDRIHKLRDGAAKIGEGDLDHRIDLTGNDEFADLSAAFNAMTAKLQGSYRDLEREIEERRRAEEALRRAHDDLELRVQERTKELLEARDMLEQRVTERTAELLAANETLRASRRASLNLMEDALSARHDTEKANDDLKRSVERFELLAATAGALLQVTDPQRAVESLCKSVMAHLDCHAFFNFLVDERAGRLHLNACAGIPEEESRRIEWLDFGVAVCGCVARDGARIVAEHIPAIPDTRTELVKTYGIKAYCCHPLLGPAGKVIGTLSFGTKSRETFSEDDLSLMKAVTDQVAAAMTRKRSELEILKLSEDMAARNLELETVNRELESFVYSVSHDLRAPLRSVSGFAKILVEDYVDKLDAQASDYLARIYSGSEKMSQRIEALMHLTKISRQGLERVEVNLSRVASSIVFDLRQANPGRNIEVVIAEGLAASADLNLLKVALSNLFENAWKFTSKTADARIEFGQLDCGLRNADCGVKSEIEKTVYYVKDNGAGFDPTYADRMFWPFHRLHTDQEFEGTGIGLAIVERVVRRHGGKVWAEGEPGKGATFYFTL
jgi:signal transduction histidine kinase/methyl-accepting chemotaxis protein